MICEFRLRFTETACDVCGSKHAVWGACPSCGASRDAKSDPLVEQRRAIVSEAAAVLAGDEEAQGSAVGFDAGVFGRMDEWLDQFMGKCSRAASDEDVRKDLGQLARELMRWKATTARRRNVDTARARCSE